MSQSPKTPNSNKANTKEEPRTAKGMRDLFEEELFFLQGFNEKASEIAIYYGFKPIETPILEKESLFTKGIGSGTDIVDKEMYSLKTKGGDKLVLRPEGTAPTMRAYFEHGLLSEPQPIMLYSFGPYFRHENPQQGRYRQFWQFSLEILGSPKSISDATVIKLLTLILSEAGVKDLTVHINSIGDKNCRPAFVKELSSYYQKQAKDICSDCRQRLKTNPLRVLDCDHPKCQKVKKDAPEAVNYLCPECRQHFKEVLEYLDGMSIPYQINNNLVRGLDYYSRTVFEITSETPSTGDSEPTNSLALASGGRYDGLGKEIGGKKNISAVGGSVGVDRLMATTAAKKLTPRIIKKPKVFFIQLGLEAKLKSFEVIETLRRAKIPLTHSLTKDSLSAQLAQAEKLNIPYTIILGQKEAIENSVIVRNMESRSQDTVSLNDLPNFLKKIKCHNC